MYGIEDYDRHLYTFLLYSTPFQQYDPSAQQYRLLVVLVPNADHACHP
jgi:hypothetical protein